MPARHADLEGIRQSRAPFRQMMGPKLRNLNEVYCWPAAGPPGLPQWQKVWLRSSWLGDLPEKAPPEKLRLTKLAEGICPISSPNRLSGGEWLKFTKIWDAQPVDDDSSTPKTHVERKRRSESPEISFVHQSKTGRVGRRPSFSTCADQASKSPRTPATGGSPKRPKTSRPIGSQSHCRRSGSSFALGPARGRRRSTPRWKIGAGAAIGAAKPNGAPRSKK